MMLKDLKPYRPKGLLALAPKALGELFPEHNREPAPEASDVAIIPVCGPLCHQVGWLLSYQELLAGVKAAAASEAHTIVLKIDSPGGDVAGVLDAAREIRKVAKAAGKRLLAYSDSLIASAAYALAASAEEIVVSGTACVGSIGVIEALVDATAADEAMGLRWTLVTSGKLKGTGNPHATLSEEGKAEVQQHVDDMAGEFFAWVKEARGFDPAPLEAAVFVGRRAIVAQLADRILPWDEFLQEAKAAPQEGPSSSGATQGGMTLKAESDAEAAKKYLKKMAESEDEVEAKRAKRALEAFDNDEKKDEAEAEDEPKKDDEKDDEKDKKEAKAEDDKKEASAEDKDKEAKATMSLAAQVQAQAQELAQLKAIAAKAAKAEEAAKREAIFAARPDVTPDLKKSLAELPLERVQTILDTIPKGKVAAGTFARPSVQSGAGSQLPGPSMSGDELSVRMGLVKSVNGGSTFETNRLTLGVPQLDPKALEALSKEGN